MNRRKRNRVDTDSLDLLLDALCNMFGGIIFIALLIVLLTSEASKTNDGSSSTTQLSTETRILQGQAASLEEQLDLALEDNLSSKGSLYQILEILEQTKAQKADAIKVLEKDGQQTVLENQAELEAIAELGRLVSIADDLQEKLISPDEDDLAEAVNEEREAVQEIQKKLNSIDQRRVLHARLPRERQSRLIPVWIILERDRAYVTIASNGDFDDFDPRDVIATPTAGSGYLYTPKLKGGIQINDNISNHPRLHDLINTYPNNSYFIIMQVRSTAHEAFQQFKAALISRGYSYNLNLTEQDLILYSGGNPNRSIQ